MTRPTDVEVADVWRENTRVGTISREPHGSTFEYDAGFFAQHARRPGGIATHLAYLNQRIETRGVNLHPYFAGLLPEGLRLQALIHRVKTSADDLLSLLVASGVDTVGNLSVLPSGETPEDVTSPPTPLKSEEVLFSELFEQSLSRAGEERDEPMIPGVQEKLSGSSISFPLKSTGRHAYILKLNPHDKPQLVQNEDFFMRMAKDCGLVTANTRLVQDREGNPGLLVERFDRAWSKTDKAFQRIHQEDACQFLDRYPDAKYHLKCAEIAEGLREYCVAPIPEMSRFLRLIAFSYLIANGDLHAKNVSILADGPAGGFRLSPAYDVLTTLPYGDRRMALMFEGRNDNLKASHFIAFGTRFGVKEPAIRRMLSEIIDGATPWFERLGEIGFDTQKTEHLHRNLEKRSSDLQEG